MHIGTGQFEGKKLKDSHDGAPLSTRILTIKESIFEIIGARIHEASVLDINDQNGMYGIEAISKGAAAVQFLNLHEEDKKLVRDNLKIVDLNPDDFILRKSPEEFLKSETAARFDVIFFRATDDHCIEMLGRVLDLQNQNGITAVFYPNTSGCVINIPEGYEMIDSRDVETERILVMVKSR
jgi:16S rRNA (guanine966-N2)-methyltransferase